MEKDPLQPNGPPQTSLVEIGPRFVLTPIRIFEGAFGGATVYSNPGSYTGANMFLAHELTSQIEFVTPASVRSVIRHARGDKYRQRKEAQEETSKRKVLRKRDEDALAVSKVFA
jgi:ribosome biogenesis protein BRX1